MSAGLPEMLVSRHVSRLVEVWGADKVRELLKRSGLQQTAGPVERIDGTPMTMQDCYEYKVHVRELFGDRAYDFARVNFILGGCRCQDCKMSGGGTTIKLQTGSSDSFENRHGKRGEDL